MTAGGSGLAFTLADARGITLHVEHISGEHNRAHGPALAALRQADTRPRLEVHLHVRGSSVRVRGDGLRVHDTYPAPATLHALAEALPPQVIALVHGIAPLAEAVWTGRPDTPPELRRPVTRTQQALGCKRSHLHPAYMWWEHERARR